MKWTKSTVTALLAVLVAGVTIAASWAIVSNVWTGQNEVVEDPLQVSQVDIQTESLDDQERKNWSEGQVTKDMEYDAGIRLQNVGTESYDSVLVKFEIVAADGDISSSDVTLQYWSGSEWLTVNTEASGDTLSGHFGPSEGFPVSEDYDETTPILIEYHTVDTYDISVWAEALN